MQHAGILLIDEKTLADNEVRQCMLSMKIARYGVINQKVNVGVLKYADLKYIVYRGEV